MIQTICDCDSCKYCGECTTDDMASCAHGANMSCGSDYEPKERENAHGEEEQDE